MTVIPMTVIRRVFHVLVVGCALGFFCSAAASAEEAATLTSAAPQSSSTAASPQAQSPPQFATAGDETSDSKWHIYSTGYLWLPGIHGTLGVNGFQTGVHVSAIDLLSNFRFGLMGAVIPTYNRFSVPIDYFWARLKDNKAVPFNPAYTASAKVTESIITPKVAYLVLNNPKMKAYGTFGTRIWYESTTLELSPSIEGFSPSQSTAWADVVAGARFSAPLGPKVSLDVLGDAGAGKASLDYQVGGFLNYQWKPKLSLQAGWRYLTIHYQNNDRFFDGTMQGMVLGATYKFK